ncbi:MAG: formylglycine-generating enzyme family protein [Ferruginibacter sp.]
MKQVCFLFISTFITTASLAQTKNTSYKTGETFTDCKDCPEMIVIPAGSFMMGAKENEPNSYPEEKPQRQVSIKQFACGKFDITKKQWAVFVKETNRPATGGCAWSGLPDSLSKPWDPNPAANWNHIGFVQDSSHPVVCITWYDAQEYVQWLSAKTGFNYRLLTEAEWEYSVRAGTTTTYYWGDNASHEYANYGADTGWGTVAAKGRDKWLHTSPVGSFPSNAFGLYDMAGNVLQYLEDCFKNSYNGLPLDGSAYKADSILNMTGDLAAMNGTKACDYRMVRGGDFGDPPGMLRSAFRNWAPGPGATLKTYSSSGLSFRVARTL